MAIAGRIIQHAPRQGMPGAKFVLVDRGAGVSCPFVVATVTPESESLGEWMWGHYFSDIVAAASYFDEVTGMTARLIPLVSYPQLVPISEWPVKETPTPEVVFVGRKKR